MSYERDEMAAEGGFVRFGCRGCGRLFWSDGPVKCEQCRMGWAGNENGDYGNVMDAQDAGLRPKEEVWDK